MKEFNIKLIDGEVYINDKLHYFAAKMDNENDVDDLNKKILLALANEMEYEPVYLFEEMADRLHEIIEDVDKGDNTIKLKLSSLYGEFKE